MELLTGFKWEGFFYTKGVAQRILVRHIFIKLAYEATLRSGAGDATTRGEAVRPPDSQLVPSLGLIMAIFYISVLF